MQGLGEHTAVVVAAAALADDGGTVVEADVGDNVAGVVEIADGDALGEGIEAASLNLPSGYVFGLHTPVETAWLFVDDAWLSACHLAHKKV